MQIEVILMPKHLQSLDLIHKVKIQSKDHYRQDSVKNPKNSDCAFQVLAQKNTCVGILSKNLFPTTSKKSLGNRRSSDWIFRIINRKIALSEICLKIQLQAKSEKLFGNCAFQFLPWKKISFPDFFRLHFLQSKRFKFPEIQENCIK